MSEKTQLFEGPKFDWEGYLFARPDYTQNEFYSILWDYHNAKGGKWNRAYDVAAGPGNVSEILASKFEHVVTTDLVPFHMVVAQKRLAGFGEKISFKACRAEDVADLFPHASADMITAAECMPLLDPKKAVSAFAKLLRPGGTLAIWSYGGPCYEDPDLHALHRKITARSFDQFRPMKGTFWEQPSNACFSWLDNVEFPSDEWSAVKRKKWNHDQPFAFEDESEVDFEVKKTSAIKPSEEVEEMVDRTFWAKQANIAWTKSFIDAQVPRTKDYKSPEVLKMFDGMEDLMSGPGKTQNVFFPVVLMLATKN